MKLWRAVYHKALSILGSFNGPAQPEGLWEHHVNKDGLIRHTNEVIYYIMQIANIILCQIQLHHFQ